MERAKPNRTNSSCGTGLDIKKTNSLMTDSGNEKI